jgi:hypothetical protein
MTNTAAASGRVLFSVEDCEREPRAGFYEYLEFMTLRLLLLLRLHQLQTSDQRLRLRALQNE